MFEWLLWLFGYYKEIDPEVEYNMLHPEIDNIRDYFKSLKTT